MTKGTLFSLKGVPELKAALKKPMSLAAVKTIVKTNTLELAQKTQQNMASTYVHTNPKTGNKYSTGHPENDAAHHGSDWINRPSSARYTLFPIRGIGHPFYESRANFETGL